MCEYHTFGEGSQVISQQFDFHQEKESLERQLVERQRELDQLKEEKEGLQQQLQEETQRKTELEERQNQLEGAHCELQEEHQQREQGLQ